MYKPVIFVDFENLQDIDTSIIKTETKIIVMVGLNQDNKAFEFAKNLFNNVSSIELIKVNGRGNNALDFFIAFYLGKYFDNIKETETPDVKTILEYLKNQTKSQKNKRPKKRTTLENDLYTHFSKNISINKIKEAIDFMIKNNIIKITNNKIDYKTI